MEMIGFLILFPLIIAGLLVVIRKTKPRNIIVCVGSAAIAIASIALVVMNIGTTGTYFTFQSDIVNYACLGISVLIGIVVICFGVKYKNIPALVLAIVQLAGSLVYEFYFAHDLMCYKALYIDSLSLIMALIIGIIGTGICVYSIGYMHDFYFGIHHPDTEQPERRPTFFALMFVFLSAMYGIIFFNNLIWLFTAWEVTTLCSFLLIGFTKTDEAIANSFRQIIMNLVGGIAFLGALYYLAINFQCIDFTDFIVFGTVAPALVVLPLTCFSLAGITKAAQMPFHTWLLGAMVAPTPTSALLHSSTMVKAGVFMLIKCAPIYAVSFAPSILVILVGGITFLLCSFMAISQSNGKRVLAYSTIANLGLITACAGVGTAEAIWAAIFLVIFHAIAKSLLFLCVGTAEHHIGSRDIEDMDLLFERMPRLSRMMIVGIMIMFLAPFGMLVAKWATLVTFVDTRQFALLLMLAFGSAATFMFWAKWIGKLAGITGTSDSIEQTVHWSEWVATMTFTIMALAACAAIPLISDYLVEPYIGSVLGIAIQPVLDDDLYLSAIIVIVLAIVLLGGLRKFRKNIRKQDVYLSGVSVDNGQRVFINSLSQPMEATARNWYLEPIFGEEKIRPIGTIACYLLLIAAFGWAAYSSLVVTGIL